MAGTGRHAHQRFVVANHCRRRPVEPRGDDSVRPCVRGGFGQTCVAKNAPNPRGGGTCGDSRGGARTAYDSALSIGFRGSHTYAVQERRIIRVADNSLSARSTLPGSHSRTLLRSLCSGVCWNYTQIAKPRVLPYHLSLTPTAPAVEVNAAQGDDARQRSSAFREARRCRFTSPRWARSYLLGLYHDIRVTSAEESRCVPPVLIFHAGVE
jgi:hypothetical protein